MLKKLYSIEKFKYSLIALCGLSCAIVLNLLFILNISTVILLSLICILFIAFSFNFFENNKLIVTFCLLFLAGLANSTIYNQFYRVYELDNKINDERAWVIGQITEIKERNKYARVYIKNPDIYSDVFENLEYKHTPKMIISTHASRVKEANIGDTITVQVLLRKPNTKLFEDDFDYQEYLLQNKINLLGQVRGAIYIDKPLNKISFLDEIRNYRLQVAEKIKQVYGNSDAAGISTAFITGLRGLVSYEVQENFKASGLAHLMAISGMHMAFLSAIVFFLVRSLICLIPGIALNYNSKNIAGVVTIFFAFFYLVLAGNTIPTTRAFLMIFLFVLTMLCGRHKVALHTLCVIAIIMLLIDPMAIFTVSFQLSFSAVFAMLIYNAVKQHELIVDYSFKAKTARKFSNVVNISIIAFTATMFIVAVHFGYISIYSVLANVCSSLLMGFVVMPMLFFFFIGYIIFDIKIFATLNEYSLNALNAIAKYFANFENSYVYVSTEYSFFLLIATALVLALIIFDYPRKYLLSFVIYVIAFTIPIKFDFRPDIINFGKDAIGLRQGDDLMVIGELHKRELAKVARYYRLNITDDLNLNTSCDLSGCIYHFKDKQILKVGEGFDVQIEELNMVDYVLYEYNNK